MRSEDAGRTLVAGARLLVLARCRSEAQWLRQVRAITRLVHQEQAWLLGVATRWSSTRGGSITEHDLDVLAALEVAAAAGCSRWQAERDVEAARVLLTVLTRTWDALAAGRVDGARARVLVEETTGLSDAAARKVEAVVLDGLPAEPLVGTGPVGPWDGPSPRAFTARVRRAVTQVRTDTEEQVRADLRERTGTWVQVDPANPAIATLTVTGPTEQVVAIADTLEVGARALTDDELAGRTLGMARVDLLSDAVTGERAGARAGGSGVQRELGVVVGIDTLLGDGPAADAAGEVRGVGAPVPATAAQARVAADDLLARGASTCVLVADPAGHLLRMLRVGAAPAAGWTRITLVDAARRALATAPQPRHRTDTYTPTVEIAETVRARDPACTFPGCAVPASHCDLDHTIPWPHGPTSVTNLGPRSRRCHRYKTAALWRCRARTDEHGAVAAHEWISPLGTRQVVEVEPLPGTTASTA